MIATWVFLALLAIIGTMMVLRGDLTKMAYRYLRSNPRQSFVAVMGLMVSSATIVGSAIVTDSAAAALEQKMERIRGDTDFVVDFGGRIENTSFASELDSVEGVAGASWISHTEVPFLTEDGYIRNEETVYGVQSDYSDAVRWEAVEGNLDGADLVVTQSLAQGMGLSVGTSVDMLFPKPWFNYPDWGWHVVDDNREWTMSRTDVDSNGGAPDPNDSDLVEEFSIEVPDTAVGLDAWFNIDYEGGSSFTVQWIDPEGTSRMNESASAVQVQNRFSGVQRWHADDAFIAGGNYTVRVSTPDAVDADVSFDWTIIDTYGTPPWIVEVPEAVTLTRTVDAIVLDGADPAGDGDAAFIPYTDFQDAAPDKAGAAFIVGAVEEGAHVRDTGIKVARLAMAQQPGTYDVEDLHAEEERAVRQLRQEMAQLWGFLAGFTVISAVILIFVLMALLTDERRATLATIRAIGAPRSVLVRLQVFEALGLAILAGLAGGIIGMIVAAILAWSVGDLFLTDHIVLRASSIIDAISIGVMLTIAFAFIASKRVSRIEIAPALRDMDAPARGSRWRDVIIAAGIAVFAAFVLIGTRGSGPVAATLGIPMLMLSGGIIASRWLPKDIVFPAVGLGFVVWMISTRAVIAEVTNEWEALMLPIRALLYAIGGGLLFAYFGRLHQLVGKAFSWLPGGFHLEQSIAQWRTRPGRAAMTIIMLSMMLMGVMFMASLVNVTERESGSYAGDYDVVSWINEPGLDPEAWLAEHPPAAGIDPFEGVVESVQLKWAPFTESALMEGGDGGPVFISAALEVNAEYVAAQDHRIMDGDADAFERLLTDPSAMIVDSDLWAGNHLTKAGDHITFYSGNEQVHEVATFEVIAVTDGRGFQAAYFNPEGFEQAVGEYGTRYGGAAIFMVVEDGVNPDQVAARMDAGFHEANPRSEVIDPEPPGIDAIKAVLYLFVFLALAIGAIALGLIAARNVVRRRREIGMVRAIGGTRRQVVTSITLETVMLVFVAVVIAWTGTVILIEGLFSDTSYSIDIGRAILLSIYTLAISAVAAIIPAYTAARYDPAVAVRNQE